MTIVVTISLALVVVSALAGLIRIALGPDDATRAVVADLLFFCAIAIFVLAALLGETAVLFDVTLVATLTGILATIALARMLTRGER